MRSAYQTLYERGEKFTATDIKEQFQGCIQHQATFLQQYDKMLAEVEQHIGVDIQKQSLAVYYNTRRQLRAFFQDYYKSDDITFSQIGEDFIDNFERYAKSKRKYAQSYFFRFFILVKKTCKMAYRDGL